MSELRRMQFLGTHISIHRYSSMWWLTAFVAKEGGKRTIFRNINYLKPVSFKLAESSAHRTTSRIEGQWALSDPDLPNVLTPRPRIWGCTWSGLSRKSKYHLWCSLQARRLQMILSPTSLLDHQLSRGARSQQMSSSTEIMGIDESHKSSMQQRQLWLSVNFIHVASIEPTINSIKQINQKG